MIVPEKMQQTMHQQMGHMRVEWLCIARGLSDHSFISEDDIAEMTPAVRLHRLAERECKYIRRAIDGTVLEIQLPHFGVRTQNKTCFRRAIIAGPTPDRQQGAIDQRFQSRQRFTPCRRIDHHIDVNCKAITLQGFSSLEPRAS